MKICPMAEVMESDETSAESEYKRNTTSSVELDDFLEMYIIDECDEESGSDEETSSDEDTEVPDSSDSDSSPSESLASVSTASITATSPVDQQCVIPVEEASDSIAPCPECLGPRYPYGPPRLMVHGVSQPEIVRFQFYACARHCEQRQVRMETLTAQRYMMEPY